MNVYPEGSEPAEEVVETVLPAETAEVTEAVEEAMEDMATNGDEVGDVATTMALDAGRDDSGGQDEESKVLPRP